MKRLVYVFAMVVLSLGGVVGTETAFAQVEEEPPAEEPPAEEPPAEVECSVVEYDDAECDDPTVECETQTLSCVEYEEVCEEVSWEEVDDLSVACDCSECPADEPFAMANPRRRRNNRTQKDISVRRKKVAALSQTANGLSDYQDDLGLDPQVIKDKVANGEGESVIDVGCGWCAAVAQANGGLNNTNGIRGLDPQLSDAMTAGRPHLVAATAQDLGTEVAFPNGDFDIVIMHNTWPHSVVPNEGAAEDAFTRDDAVEAMDGINRVTHSGSEMWVSGTPTFFEVLAESGWVQDPNNPHHWTRR